MSSGRSRYSNGDAVGRRVEPASSTPLSALRQDNDSEIADIIRDATSAVRQLIAEANDVDVIVLKNRIAAAEPATLAEIGRWVRRTGERVRGIESKLRSRIDEALGPFLGQVISPLTDWLGDFADDERLRGAIAALTGGADDLAGRIISRRLMVELGYQDNGGIWTSRRAVAAARQLAALAREFSDDFGCVAEERLRRSELGQRWSDDWAEMLSVAGLTRVCGVLVLASTRRAQVAAALMSIGRPATKAEIEDRLRPEIEGPMFRVDAVLAGMGGVVRASKTTWGFDDWVDDVYEGIPAEIRQRINEDGGSTRLSRLLDEIPRLFGVKEASVRAYVETPAFVVEHEWVREATHAPTVQGVIDDIADAVTAAGEPVWTFAVEDRFLHGYSLTNVPPEVSVALGAGFGRKASAAVKSPAGCPAVSVIWRKTSIHGPEIGRIAAALRGLGARAGTSVGLVVHGSAEVSFLGPEQFKHRTRAAQISVAAGDVEFTASGQRFSGVRTARRLQAHVAAPAKRDSTHLEVAPAPNQSVGAHAMARPHERSLPPHNDGSR
ncbi:hypothetical protein [Candidatus Poriferisodalis sp.]|uniref:hypothetical protein n=1 Tax=Candidatus Poriferisodalis sp. TaxID=3101277 RepID=UPI003B0229DD